MLYAVVVGLPYAIIGGLNYAIVGGLTNNFGRALVAGYNTCYLKRDVGGDANNSGTIDTGFSKPGQSQLFILPAL
jgi:hypothetical protein